MVDFLISSALTFPGPDDFHSLKTPRPQVPGPQPAPVRLGLNGPHLSFQGSDLSPNPKPGPADP